MYTVIAFVIIFGSLVFFHEAGHLYFAKRAGILCREFAIGFGPKILSFTKNETNYTIRLLPLGGYVRMAGEDPETTEIKPGQKVGLLFNKEDKIKKIIVSGKSKYQDLRSFEVEKVDLEHHLYLEGYEEGDDTLRKLAIHPKATVVDQNIETQIAPWDRQFGSKSLGKRAMTIFAGPLMNFILAIVLFTVLAVLQGVPVTDPVVGKLTADGAAKINGLKQGDTVISIDGSEVSDWNDIVEIVQKHPNQEITFTVERNKQTLDIPVTPKSEKVDNKEIGRIGVYSPVEKSPIKVLTFGVQQTYHWTVEILKIVGTIITGHFSVNMLSGPVGIYKSTEEVAKSGIYYLVRWAALLSINLGIMNLLPIPALDGGRLLFFGIEALRGKPLDRQKESIVHFVGFALLMLLMIIVTWNDIQRFFL